MRNYDEDLMEASIHYGIAKCGGLARVSTPYNMQSNTKMGVGFDYLDKGYLKFAHTHKKGGKQFKILSHRMIYYLHYGELPEFIDHIDGETRNNSILNLRAATRSQNSKNSRSAKNSSSIFLGVSWHKQHKKWKASIAINSKNSHLGYFTCEKEAASMYNLAAIEHHGEYANLNNV
tara:strand:+ start:253 stop:780 length:528 start_codon:yes stop_codon:yes gene_type:complete